MSAGMTRRSVIQSMAAALLLGWIHTDESRAAQATLEGPSVADAVLRLKPGQYLWAPQVAPAGPVLMVISLPKQHCYVYRNGVLIGVSTVSTGKTGHETPTGVFTVLQKHVDHKSNLYNSAPMPYMQRLTWTGIAMHAGHLPGFPASHGCVRLPLAFSKLLYGATKLGMTVVITDSETLPRAAPTPDLLQDPVSAAVQGGASTWQPENSRTGPVSLILSGADHRLIVLRNGKLIGSTSVTIAGPVQETAAYSLSKIDASGFHWLQLPLPGQSWAGQRELTAAERARVGLPDNFRKELDSVLTPGVTLVVTAESLQAGSTGQSLTVLDSQPTTTVR